jgi:hypothetical protein
MMSAPPSAPVERRAAARQPCPRGQIVTVVLRPTFTVLKATLRDVSPGGVGLSVKPALQPGVVVALQPPSVRPGPLRTVLGKVVHATPEPTGGCLLGCELEAPLDEDELRACVQ